jgi:hypothetical protein
MSVTCGCLIGVLAGAKSGSGRRHSQDSGRVTCRHAVAFEAAAFDGLVVPDDVLDDEREDLLGDHGIEARVMGQASQALDLTRLAARVTRGHARCGFQFSDRLSELESLREQANQGAVDVVDAVSQVSQSFSRSIGHGSIFPRARRGGGLIGDPGGRYRRFAGRARRPNVGVLGRPLRRPYPDHD